MWRYDPPSFDLGACPFRARGLAYVHALGYVDAKVKGGRPAVVERLGDVRLAAFFDQIFLVTGDYDVAPLVRLFSAVAEMTGTSVGAFIERRAARSGSSDPKGVWKPMLHGRTPAEVASRLYLAFGRYFPPCQAEPISSNRGLFEGELRGIPACMNGLYASSTAGFYTGALEGVGARGVTTLFQQPVDDGVRDGLPLQRVRFAARWLE